MLEQKYDNLLRKVEESDVFHDERFAVFVDNQVYITTRLLKTAGQFIKEIANVKNKDNKSIFIFDTVDVKLIFLHEALELI